MTEHVTGSATRVLNPLLEIYAATRVPKTNLVVHTHASTTVIFDSTLCRSLIDFGQ